MQEGDKPKSDVSTTIQITSRDNMGPLIATIEKKQGELGKVVAVKRPPKAEKKKK